MDMNTDRILEVNMSNFAKQYKSASSSPVPTFQTDVNNLITAIDNDWLDNGSGNMLSPAVSLKTNTWYEFYCFTTKVDRTRHQNHYLITGLGVTIDSSNIIKYIDHTIFKPTVSGNDTGTVQFSCFGAALNRANIYLFELPVASDGGIEEYILNKNGQVVFTHPIEIQN